MKKGSTVKSTKSTKYFVKDAKEFMVDIGLDLHKAVALESSTNHDIDQAQPLYHDENIVEDEDKWAMMEYRTRNVVAKAKKIAYLAELIALRARMLASMTEEEIKTTFDEPRRN